MCYTNNKRLNTFLQFLLIIIRKQNNYLENYTLKFIELNNEDLQHCL